jgi:hypothetical protein
MAQQVLKQYIDGVQGAVKGRIFSGNSADGGIALIAPATGGGHPTLINFAGSRCMVMIRRLRLTYVSGTNAPVGIIYAKTTGIGAAAATGTPLLTATAATKEPALLGSGQTGNPLVVWSPTTNTFTAAPTSPYRDTGISLLTGAAATAVAPFTLFAEEGYFGLYPGTAISICSKGATTTALFRVTLEWEEVPFSEFPNETITQ